MNRRIDRSIARTIDWKLIACYVALLLVGWVSIYASVHSTEPSSIFDLSSRCGKQFLWIMISIVVGIGILFGVKPTLWEDLSIPAYLMVVALLGVVLFFGTEVNGSKSWFVLGPVSFQPCELSKITTSLVLAHFLRYSNFRFTNLRDAALIITIIGIPALIILAEGETGTLLVYVGYVFMLYREGLSGWWLVFMIAAVVLFIMSIRFPLWVAFSVLGVVTLLCFLMTRRTLKRAAARRSLLRAAIMCLAAGSALILSTNVVFNHVLKPHQQTRIEVLLRMKEDPMGAGYNVNQSMIAIGSGGLTGKGFLQGTQTAYGFVPEQSTDFIFCTIGEEFGFVGCTIVILLFVYLIARILKDAEEVREPFTRVYGYCLAGCIFMHLLINVGMTIGLMPVVGIPLPLISYGGSSMLSFSVMIFIFLALIRQERKYF